MSLPELAVIIKSAEITKDDTSYELSDVMNMRFILIWGEPVNAISASHFVPYGLEDRAVK